MSHPLSQRLDALSHRAWLVAALECASLGAAAGAMAGATMGGWLALAFGAAGTTIGVTVSRSLVPSRIEIARRLDRRFALQERLVTAVEAEHADDAMAALLRDDAWQRVSGRTLSEAFAPRPGRLVAAAVMVVVAVGWSFRSPWAMSSTPAQLNVAAATAGNAGVATPPPSDSAPGETAATAIPSSDGPAQSESALPPPASPASAPASTNPADTPSASASFANAGGTGQAATNEGMTASGQGATEGKPGRALSGIAAVALNQDAGSQAAPEAEAPITAAAAARARAALARRDLPPGLRTYVRDYFLLVTQ